MKIERIRLHEWVLGLCVAGLLLAAMLRRSESRVSVAAAPIAPSTTSHAATH